MENYDPRSTRSTGSLLKPWKHKSWAHSSVPLRSPRGFTMKSKQGLSFQPSASFPAGAAVPLLPSLSIYLRNTLNKGCVQTHKSNLTRTTPTLSWPLGAQIHRVCPPKAAIWGPYEEGRGAYPCRIPCEGSGVPQSSCRRWALTPGCSRRAGSGRVSRWGSLESGCRSSSRKSRSPQTQLPCQRGPGCPQNRNQCLGFRQCHPQSTRRPCSSSARSSGHSSSGSPGWGGGCWMTLSQKKSELRLCPKREKCTYSAHFVGEGSSCLQSLHSRDTRRGAHPWHYPHSAKPAENTTTTSAKRLSGTSHQTGSKDRLAHSSKRGVSSGFI